MMTARAAAVFVAALAFCACKPKHVAVSSVTELPYPACDGADAGAGDVLAHGVLRGSADSMAEASAAERFELRRHACLVVATVRQEWSRGATDVEVVFDEALRPLRAWKRMAAAGSRHGELRAEIRRYELRTPEVTITRRDADGARTHEILRGPRPVAVIGPGRGLLTAWIRRAHLAVGEKVREPVLDFRERVEVLRDVTLRREADRVEPSLGRTVRVYTIYGREALFADETDAVVGDLAGMRLTEGDAAAMPGVAASLAPPDPRGTP